MSLAGLLKATSHVGTSKLRSLTNGKRVALVGNAKSLFGQNLGAEIDRHDVVIRLNRGFVEDPTSQGSRTDIVGTARPLTLDQIHRYDPQLVYWLFWRWWRIPTWDAVTWSRTEVVPISSWKATNALLKGRPTSGFVMCRTLLELAKPAELNIFGFDFYKTENFYRGNATTRVHMHDEEEEAFLALLQKFPTAKIIKP